MPSPETFRFQVNLGGMLDILSNHLYKSPDVFLRELLQNGIDAITLRKKKQPAWSGGRITITLDPAQSLVFQDNGAGLSKEEIHQFLAVIGQSSKTMLNPDGSLPEDFIGRFGIGLLSCFMVSDSIVIETQSSAGGQAWRWTGHPDGTYLLEPLEAALVGTSVTLTAKKGSERYFTKREIARLVRYYGLALPAPVFFAGESEPLNQIPGDFSTASRRQLLAFGSWIFDEDDFLDVIPISTPHISGAAFVLPYRTDPSANGGHRIYLKQMLLTEQGEALLPPWAFFFRCFLNTRGLRPTASREDFYEDDALEEARKEFSDAIQGYLEMLSREDPDRLRQLVEIHSQAIKSMAVWDDELFRIFSDYLSFETSEGRLTGRHLKKAEEGSWVESLPRFQQLKPVFLAQGKLLICTAYVHDQELIRKMTWMFSRPFQPLQEDGMDLVMEEPTLAEKQKGFAFLRAAGRVLAPLDCKGELRRFLPAGLTGLYSLSEDAQFLRQVEKAQETESILSGALGALLSGGMGETSRGLLYFNLNNPLIQRLLELEDGVLLENALRVLYVQALLAGGHTLRGGEMKVMNEALLELVEQASAVGEASAGAAPYPKPNA